MWAAQYLHFEDPNRWMTSGGLGTMGYGFPASIGVQMAHRDALVINVAGEASWLMNMQEMGTAMQFNLPVKQFILNNERLGMVRQWQQLLHGERYSQSWSEALPDFVKLAEAFGAKGIICKDPADLDDAIMEMINYDGPVIFDCLVEKHENCFPMIPSGEPHNKMLLGDASTKDAIKEGGAVLVYRATGGPAPPCAPSKARPKGPPFHRTNARQQGRTKMNALHIKKGSNKHSAYNLRPNFSDQVETHTLAVLVDNEAGVLARVIGLFSGRGYNIESLTVAEVDHLGHLSRITIVTRGTPQVIEQIKAQLGRIVPVHQVHDLTVEGPSVERELALLKVASGGDKRVEALRLADIFRANVVDSTLDSFVFEITGAPDKIDAFADLMRPLGLIEMARTGVAALSRGAEA
jgi:acetolactate synthase small subunit